MGVVIRQSFWASVLAYLGVGIGYVNTLYLRPKYLELDQIGLLNLIVSNAIMFAPWAALGMPAALIKYYPNVENKETNRQEFLSFQFYVVAISSVILALGVYLFIEPIKSIFESESALYNEYIFMTIIIMTSQSIFMLLQSYSRVVMDVIIPGFLKDIYLRLGYAGVIFAFGLGVISFDLVVKLLVITYVTATLIEVVHVFVNQRYRIKFIRFSKFKSWFKNIWHYNIYNIVTAIGTSGFHNLNFLLIPVLIGLDANGVFTIAFYVAIVIEMPKRALLIVTAPIISREITNQNLTEVNDLYKRSSLTMTSIGLLLFIGIICNISDLFEIIPKGKDLESGFGVIVMISLAKLFDMVFALAPNILLYSNHYTTNAKYLIISLVLAFILSYLLIPILGINGAALSFLLSTVFFCFIKNAYLKKQMNITPFSNKHPILLIIGILLIAIFFKLEITSIKALNIILKSGLITIIYILLIYRLKISKDINLLIKSNLYKYLKISINE